MIRFFLLTACTLLVCTFSFSKNLPTANIAPLLLSLDSLQQPDCAHPLGYIAVSASGGDPAYTYVWNTGETGRIITNLSTGDYEVVVTDDSGSKTTLSISIISDFEAPLAEAGDPLLVLCSNSISTLNGSGSGGPGFSYQWQGSAGGHIVSGGNTLHPVVDHEGAYVLTVTNQTNGCTTTDQVNIAAQHAAPSAAATGGIINCTSASIALSVTYTTLHTAFIWQGPGGFSSHVVNPSVSVAGNYVFTLTDTLSGCIQKSTAVVTANFAVPNADAAGGGVITCALPAVQLTGSSTTPAAVYHWTGPLNFASSEQNPSVNNPGIYTLTVQNPVNGCTATDAVVVTSNTTAPNAFASTPGLLTCEALSLQLSGQSSTPNVSFAWTGPNNFISGQQNPVVNAAGLYILTVKNPVNGCTSVATVMVIQNTTTPNASATGGIKTCSAPSVTLAGNSTTLNVSYSWTGPNGFVSMQKNPVVTASGTYILKVTNPVNGCTATATAVVTQNTTPPTVTLSSGTFTCVNPLAQITATSTPQGLNYTWTGPNNFTSTLQNPKVGVEGYYNVTVTNPGNGCTNSNSIFVYGNNVPPFAYAGDDRSLNCVFTSLLLNGTFSTSGPNITYLWTTDDGHIISGANLVYCSIDAEGTYQLKVTNTQSGCTDTDEVYINQSTPVTANITLSTPVHCSGGADGTAKVVGGGGNGDYTYHWSNGKLTATVTGLSAGVYTVTVSDTQGCSSTASTTINQLVLSAGFSVTHQTVPGVDNGTATVIGIGGTNPYTAKWSNGMMTLTITNLAPGPYSVTLTDASGCTLVSSTNINAANCILNGTTSVINVSCFGANNGSATLNLNGSLNPITYSWSNGGSTKTINGLAPGTYSVTGTDGSGCQVVQLAQITGPQALVPVVSAQSNVHCPSAADGALTAGVTGGTQPYTYRWSNNSTTASISGLNTGTYTLTVTDKNGCTATLSAQISGPVPIAISILQKTEVACPGDHTGSVSVSASGGQAPYAYIWSNGSTSSSLSGLAPGNYTLTLTDGNNCTKSFTTEILVDDQTAPVLLLKNIALELDNNGFASVSAAQLDNGSSDNCSIISWTVTPNTFNCTQTGPNTVTVTASDPGGHVTTGTAVVTVFDHFLPTLTCPSNISTGSCNQQVQFNLPQVSDNCAVNPAALVQTGGLPSGVVFPAGLTHQVFQYTDQAGNAGQCSFDITVGEPVNIQLSSTSASCSGTCDGAASLTQLSGGNFSLSWSNGQNTPVVTGLCAGAYTATITDSYNCVQTKMVTVGVADVQVPNLSCPANISGSYCGGPITFTQAFVTDNCPVNQSNIQLIAGLPSGSFFPAGSTVQTYAYTDAGGNTGQCSFTVNISGPSTQNALITQVTCNNLCNGNAMLNISGGNAPYAVHWSNGQSGPSAINLCAGNYNYTVVDASNCVQSGAVTVSQPDVLMLVVDQIMNDPGTIGGGSIQISAMGGVAPYTFKWTRNGSFYASTEDLNNLFPGQYLVVITDVNGCTFSSGLITVSNTVDAKDVEWQQSLSLTPNPATALVTVGFGTPLDQEAVLRLLDLNGRIVLTQEVPASTQQVSVDLTLVPAGLCLLQIQTANGQNAVRKLVVMK